MTVTVPFTNNVITIRELLGSGDETKIETMLSLYAELFPEYQHYVPRMRRRAAFASDARPGHIAHYWLIEVDDKPVGMSTFRYIYARNCALGVSFGLQPAARPLVIEGARLSAFVISRIMEQLVLDAKSMNAKTFHGLVTEVEHVDLMNHYKRMGTVELPIKYFEPVFPAGLNGYSKEDELSLVKFIPVLLGVIVNPESGRRNFDRHAMKDFALAFLLDHYGLPEDHPKVQSVIQSIPESS